MQRQSDFLTEQFKAGKAISTVRGFRSAIAAVHLGFSDGSSVPDSGPLEQLVLGMFLERPTIRNLTPPWNMQLVLETLAKPLFEPISTCPMKELSMKTVFLLSAASARRRSAIHALSLCEGHIRFDASGVRLVPDPSFLAMNQTLDFYQNPSFFLNYLHSRTHDERIAPGALFGALRCTLKGLNPYGVMSLLSSYQL